MSDHRLRLAQHGGLVGKIGHPGAIASQPRRLLCVQPAAVGDQQSNIKLAAGARDGAKQRITVSLEGTQRGEHQRLRGRWRLVGRGAAVAQRPDGVEVRRQVPPGKIEGGQRLADLRQRRQALVQSASFAEAEGARMARDNLAVAAHQPVIDAGAGVIKLLAARVGRVVKRHDRQRQVRFAVHRQRAGDRHER